MTDAELLRRLEVLERDIRDIRYALKLWHWKGKADFDAIDEDALKKMGLSWVDWSDDIRR